MTKSSAMGAPGIDAVMARCQVAGPDGKKEERFYLPATLVKGLLREAWQEFGVIDPVWPARANTWLGQESPEKGSNDPIRGALRFSDFVQAGAAPGTSPKRYRIQVDEVRGAAAGQMMLVMESPFAAGEVVEFEGTVRARTGLKDADTVGKSLERGLNWARAAGGSRSIGFGEIVGVVVTDAGTEQAAPANATPADTVWRLRLTFDRAVILSKRRIDANLFESGDTIPGGAIVGALAETISHAPTDYADLAAGLSSLCVTHAFPAESGKNRPVEPPLSLLAFGKDDVRNMIRQTQQLLAGGRSGGFDIDWKEETKRAVRKQAGWPEIPQELRVRTAIDSRSGKAKDENLFAWQMLWPQGFEWICQMDVSQLSAAARSQLAGILGAGLEPIGKTKARAKVILEAVEEPPLAPRPDYVVTLQTPALLLDPQAPMRTARELRETWRAVWDALSGGSLDLKNYFGRCSLAGGEYFRRRFQGAHTEYRPYLLTDAGSTFLLAPAAGREGDARECLEGWMRRGLPLGTAVRKFYRLDKPETEHWRECPFIPGNGYGEIAVNPPAIWQEA